MKAALFEQIKRIRLVHKEIPEIAADQVLIKVMTTGICGSEVHAFNGTHPFRKPPCILGHEVVGKVEQIGSQVSGIRPGDMVTVEPHFGCGKCPYCQEENYHLCTKKVVLGTDQWEGAFAEYLIAPEKTVYCLPDGLTPELAVLTEPLAVGVHAVQLAGVKKGDRVGVLGAGPIGLLVAVAAHYAGAETIFLTDAVDYNLDVGKQLVAAHTLNVCNERAADIVEKKLGPLDTIFITAGITSVVKDAFSLIRRKGKIISIALFEQEVPLNLNQLMISEVQMFGSSMYTRVDFNKAIEIIGSRKYPLEKIVTHHFDFEDIDQAMHHAVNRIDNPIKVLINM